jgi:PAS domain S-box-containing protein
MRLRNQLIISMFVFSVVIIVVSASLLLSEWQIAKTNGNAQKVLEIQTDASNLAYISNYYFQNKKSDQINSWQNQYASTLTVLSQINPSSNEETALISNIEGDLQRLHSIFNSSVLYIQGIPANESGIVHPLLKTYSTRLSVQNQALAFDSSVLSSVLESQANQIRQTNYFLIFAMLSAFGAFFVTIYLIAFKRTITSITKLEKSTKIIGSGNLDHTIYIKSNDEIGKLSEAFNQMTVNLKTTTTSKAELEREIEERKKAEEALDEYRKNLEKLVEERTRKIEDNSLYARTLLEASLDPLVTIDSEGKITDVNKATESATGYERGKLIGSDFSDYFTEPEKARAGYKKVFTEGFVKDYPLALRHKSGKEMLVLYNATIYSNKNGGVQGVFAAARDVSERIKLEKQLKDSERLAAIGATAGMVGHDIRNPLQAITGDLYLVKTELEELPDHQQKKNALESLDEIQNNIDYINKIVADLQDYARPLNPRAQETNIKSVVNEMVVKNGIPKNIKLIVEVEDKAERIMADPDYLKRIVSNLTLNAVQAMPNGGKLTIRAYAEEKTNDVLITVEDTGVGIPEDVKPKLFTPMMTTKSKGQGFGLAVVKRMTEGLGGTVTFESQEGKGTTFIVRFPPKS